MEKTMGLLDFFTGGNTKVEARFISDTFKTSGGDYSATFGIVAMSIITQLRLAKNHSPLSNLINNEIPNFAVLACVQLNMFAAPTGTPVEHTLQDFFDSVAKYMINMGIPREYVTGDNRNLSSDFCNELRLRLSE